MTAVRSQKSLGIVFQGSFCIQRRTKDSMGDKIYYSTPEDQLKKLISQNLTIYDQDRALTGLKLFGYSNLIKSYRDPYILKSDDTIMYRDGVSFEQISSLYFFDKALRNTVMASMQDLEEHIKEVAANVIAQSFGVDPSSYLQYRKYQNKRKRKERFSLSGILRTMNDALTTDKEPIHHYMEKYGAVPPWILFKSIYFSTIINYIDQFKMPQKKLMVSYLYNSEKLDLSEEALCKLMMDTLFICMDYRNMSAHGGRIYNYTSSNILRSHEIFGDDEPIPIHGLSKLLFVLSLFEYQNPYSRLSHTLYAELNRHCQIFPQDITYLGQILNVNITQEAHVWISENSNKFHTLQHCSGLENSKRISLKDAQQAGYIPCKRCCNTDKFKN